MYFLKTLTLRVTAEVLVQGCLSGQAITRPTTKSDLEDRAG
jgi:hypothetical protein